ncbi:hypothetical protein ARMGADRAFT_165596 [Armillaria gallica]|uniref:Uncharacterized protein n=1 Tax=Armillaria gallica TaxID=47427 RepID=A0A2H3DBG8_ARMGA|nr:hypothetical protein ARMGADRAFT_165596 [Armillaria gallica]
MVVWSLVWSCVMVLITFELANLIFSRTKQDTAAMALTAGYLNALCSHLRLQDLVDAAIWAVASIAWHNYFRLGESISSKSITFHSSRHVHRGCRMSQVAWESVKWSRMDESVYSFHQDQEVLW